MTLNQELLILNGKMDTNRVELQIFQKEKINCLEENF